jgi:hypothetical protein
MPGDGFVPTGQWTMRSGLRAAEGRPGLRSNPLLPCVMRWLSSATLSMSRVVAGYIDQTSEEMVVAYVQARENWLRNRSAAGRGARIRYAAGRTSRSVSSWMSTAIFVRAGECCRL